MANSRNPKSTPVRPLRAAPSRDRLSHIAPDGAARMVDVSPKAVTPREATASARVRMRESALDALLGGKLPKGDGLATARVAGIQAAKRTSEWVPLCHNLALDHVQVDFERFDRETLAITCTARTSARTGVEMEALVGAAAATLCIYDMAKAADKAMVIGPIQLERKTGGKSGVFVRATGRKAAR